MPSRIRPLRICSSSAAPSLMTPGPGDRENLVRLLNAAGVDYGFIDDGESCCGSEVHTLGEDGLSR